MEKIVKQLVNTFQKKIPEKIEYRDFIIQEEIDSFLNHCNDYYFYKMSNDSILFKHGNNIDIIEFKQNAIIKKNYKSNKKYPKFTKIPKEDLNKSNHISENKYKKLIDLEMYITSNTYPKFTSIIPSLDFYLNKRYKNIHNSLKVSLLKTVRSLYKQVLETKDKEINEILNYLGVKNSTVYDELFEKNKKNIIKLKNESYFLLIYYVYLLIKDIKREDQAKEKGVETIKQESEQFLNKILEKNENIKEKINFMNRFNFKQLYAKGLTIENVFNFVELVLSSDSIDFNKITIKNIDHYLYLYKYTNSIKFNYSSHVIKKYFNKVEFNKSTQHNKELTISEFSEQLNKILNENIDRYKPAVLKYEKGIDLLLNKEYNITIPRSRNFKIKKIKKIKNLNEILYKEVNEALFHQDRYSAIDYSKIFSIIEYYHKDTDLLVGFVFIGEDNYNKKLVMHENFSTVYSAKYLKKVLPKIDSII